MPLFLSNYDLITGAQKYRIPLNEVFSKNQPPSELYQGGYITNLENSHDSYGNKLGGSHWVAFYIENEPKKYPKVVYFDSFGFPPSWDTQYLLRQFIPYKWSNIQIQNVNSGICGYYALFFIWFMANMKNKYPDLDHRYRVFLKQFNPKDPTKNRTILQNLLEKFVKNS